MKKRKLYSDEFKSEAAAMVTEQGRSIADVSKSLAVGPTALRRWIQTHTSTKQPGSMSGFNAQSADQSRMNELEKQVKTLQKEPDVLKNQLPFSPGKSICDGDHRRCERGLLGQVTLRCTEYQAQYLLCEN